MRTISINSSFLFLLIFSVILFGNSPLFAETFQGVNYTIIERSNLGNIKGSIEIRLGEKVSKNFLQELALRLREDEPRKYDRLFITYYLTGMTPGSGAWATSHFTPNLEVKVLGTTLEEEKSLKNEPQSSSGKIIGEWFDDSPYVSAKYKFLKRDDKIIMIRKFKDGSGSETEMVQKTHSGKLRFEEKESNDFGEYYLVESNGDMGIYDNAGIINTMRAIK